MNQEKIGNFIRMLRVEKSMTQQELAEKIGVTDRAISKWENGRGTPDIALLIPLSTSLDITLLELLSGEKIDNENNAIINLINHQDQKIKIWKYLSIGIINIGLIIMMIILIFGFIIPTIYENSNSKGMTSILSGSMEPTLKVGTGIIYDKVDIEKVKKDDIIVYNWIDENGAFLVSENGHVRVIHRVIDITKDENGNINLITKGDNNLELDNMKVTNHNFVGIYHRKTSNLTSFFLKQKIQKYSFIFIFLIISILSILCFDIVHLKKYFLNKS